jgi:hypothetical protein
LVGIRHLCQHLLRNMFDLIFAHEKSPDGLRRNGNSISDV